jgi:hypothetical protein
MAKSKNPVLKLINTLKDAERLTDSIVNLSEQDIINNIKNLKETIKPKSDSDMQISTAVKAIIALLYKYPGFEPEVLSDLKNRVSAAEKLDVLDKYKAILPKASKSVKKTPKKEIKKSEENVSKDA